MYLSLNTPIFAWFISQIEQFLCHWMCKQEGYKCSLSIKSEGARIPENTGRGWVITHVNFFEKIALDLSLVPASYLPHFESVLIDLKLNGCTKRGLYKTSSYSKTKDATIQDLDLKIIIHFNSPIIKHWIPLNQTPHILFILLLNWQTFAALEVLG
jgi:hypothetical protein